MFVYKYFHIHYQQVCDCLHRLVHWSLHLLSNFRFHNEDNIVGECLPFLWYCRHNLVRSMAILCLRLTRKPPENSWEGEALHFAVAWLVCSARYKSNLQNSMESYPNFSSNVDEYRCTSKVFFIFFLFVYIAIIVILRKVIILIPCDFFYFNK